MFRWLATATLILTAAASGAVAAGPARRLDGDPAVHPAAAVGAISTGFPLSVRGPGGRNPDLIAVNGGIHPRKLPQALGGGMVPGVGIEPTLALRRKGF